jgi:hypothetical protein
MRRRGAHWAALALACAASAACGGGEERSAPEGPPPPLPPCAGKGGAVERPAELPGDLPLPPGTVLRAAQRPFPGQLIVRGVAPAGFDEAASFFEDELPDAGYRLGRADAEAGERESLFTGEGLRGGWRVNRIPDCDGAVTVTVVVIRQ